jgi:Ca2+-binding EF-hand superfamily protein
MHFVRSSFLNLHRNFASNCKIGKRCFSQGIIDNEFSVYKIETSGRYEIVNTSMKILKSSVSAHARDFILLGIRMDQTNKVQLKQVKRPINMILPRGDIILASFGSIKIILQYNKLIVFDPHLPAVKTWVSHLVNSLAMSEYKYFEMFVIEDLLREACDSFDRRVVLYKTLLENILSQQHHSPKKANILEYSLLYNIMKEEHSRDDEENIYKLSPLVDILYDFELELKDAQRSVLDILNNNNDLASLFLTANRQLAARDDGIIDISKNDDAELLLENCEMRLSYIINGIMNLQQKVKSQQALADMGMKLKRNRLLLLNVNLSSTSVVIGMCGLVYAAFGMNLECGFEGSIPAFYGLCTISLAATAFVYYRLLKYIRGDFSKSIEKRHITERKLLESIFLDVAAVDVVINNVFHRLNDLNSDGTVSKQEFSRLLAEVKGVVCVDEKEVDELFHLLDSNVDGIIQRKEIAKYMHESGESTTKEKEIDKDVEKI